MPNVATTTLLRAVAVAVLVPDALTEAPYSGRLRLSTLLHGRPKTPFGGSVFLGLLHHPSEPNASEA